MKKLQYSFFTLLLVFFGGFCMQSCVNTYELDELMESKTAHDTLYVDPPVTAPPLIYGYVIAFQDVHTVYGFNNKLACYGGNEMWGNFTYYVVSPVKAKLTMRWAWDSVVADYNLTFTSKNGGTFTGVLENIALGESYGVWDTNSIDGSVSGSFTMYIP